MYDPYADFTQNTLSNGIQVYSTFWDRPWVTVDVVVHAGGREDPVDRLGLAHFVEHVVSYNVSGWEREQARHFFEVNGGWVDFGATDYLSTRYRFCIPSELETCRTALSIFGSMLLWARTEKSVERERQVIKREFNDCYLLQEKMVWKTIIRKALFKGHRLETWSGPIGTPEGFLSATEADLQSFYDRYYVPANMSLVVVGGLQTKDLLTELERSLFGVCKSGVRNPISQPLKQIPIPATQALTVRISDYVDLKVDRTGFKTVWAFPSDYPRQARRVFDRVLKRILFEEIREKQGLAYAVNVSCTNYQDVCEYMIEGNVSPEATQKIADLVRKCIELVPRRQDLFERELNALMKQCLMVDCSGDAFADNSAEMLALFGRIMTVGEVFEDLQRVTHDQMAQIAAILSREQQYTFISHP